jgi:hypothetical protein
MITIGAAATVSSIISSGHIVYSSHVAAWVREEMVTKRGRYDYRERMRRQVRRLRDLSLDDIDPIARDPSLIDVPCSSGAPETNGQRIERVLKDVYERWIEAHGKMRKSQSDAHDAKQQNVNSSDAPGKCCQVS